MTITEAAREAEKNRSCISREAWRDLRFAILPTDSTDCCIPIALDKAKGKTPMRIRWEPQSDDLVADPPIPLDLVFCHSRLPFWVHQFS